VKYKPSRDLPKFAKEYHTLSPSKLAGIILQKRNKEISPESITMWFSRHGDIYDNLQRTIITKELPQLEVSPTIFENGTFEELPSVKEWLTQLDARELTRTYILQKIGALKRVCKGKIMGVDLTKNGAFCMKHPDRLTMKEAIQVISMLRQKGKDTYYIKRDLKDFLQSKGIAVGKRIAVGKPKGYGKYAKLFLKKVVLYDMLMWIKSVDFEVYVIDAFMYKNGTRIEATREALIENIAEVGDEAVITVYDKGRRSKYPKGHPWDKHIDAQLLHEMKQIIGDRKSGKVFSVSYERISRINREAIENFSPETLEQYPKLFVNHFWRHMFFQHILRACDWNYTKAGALGGSSPQSVEESYGKPPEEKIKEWGETIYITI